MDRGISGAKGREHRPAFDRLWRGAWTGALRYKVTFADPRRRRSTDSGQ